MKKGIYETIMVWDPKQETVNVKRMMIYSLIPIVSIYAMWRIQKFWIITLILIPFAIVDRILTSVIGQNSSPISLVFLGISIIVTVLLVRHYAQKYNEKIENIGITVESKPAVISSAVNSSSVDAVKKMKGDEKLEESKRQVEKAERELEEKKKRKEESRNKMEREEKLEESKRHAEKAEKELEEKKKKKEESRNKMEREEKLEESKRHAEKAEKELEEKKKKKEESRNNREIDKQIAINEEKIRKMEEESKKLDDEDESN